MKYGDFSTLVQLGVGLHAGTALLQLYGDVGLAPLVRRIGRIRGLAENYKMPADIVDELVHLESDFDIFKIRQFKAYLKYLVGNLAAAVVLIILLIVIAYEAATDIPVPFTFFVVAISVGPAAITITSLSWDSHRSSKQLKQRAEGLEERAFVAAKNAQPRLNGGCSNS